MKTIEAEWAFWKATQTNSAEDQRAHRHDGIVRHLSAGAVLETVFTPVVHRGQKSFGKTQTRCQVFNVLEWKIIKLSLKNLK